MSKVYLYACSVRYRVDDDPTVKQSVFCVSATNQAEAKRAAQEHITNKTVANDEELDEFLTVRAQAIPDEQIAIAAGHVAERMIAQGVKPITDAEREELQTMEKSPPRPARPRSILDLDARHSVSFNEQYPGLPVGWAPNGE